MGSGISQKKKDDGSGTSTQHQIGYYSFKTCGFQYI
jgi:hypothetical protein